MAVDMLQTILGGFVASIVWFIVGVVNGTIGSFIIGVVFAYVI